MSYQIYILKSLTKGRHYIGHAENLNQRLVQHNTGQVRATKYGIPWKIIYTESYQTRAEAFRREKEIKSYKGGILFKRLLGLWKD